MRKLVPDRLTRFVRRRGGSRWPPPAATAPSAALVWRKRTRQRTLWTVRLAVVLTACAGSYPHVDAATAATAQPAAELLMRAAPDADPVAALRVHSSVRMVVSGVIARVEVTERFENPSDDWLEGEYVLPLPETAAVDTLQLDVGGRVTTGEVREKRQAARLYEQASHRGQRAGLVEQRRPNLFRARVANIGPRETVVVTIGYQHVVDQDAGEYAVRIPLAITPRYEPAAVPLINGATADPLAALEDARLNPPFAPHDPSRGHVELEVLLDAGVAVEQLRSHHHPVSTTDLGNRYRITLADGSTARDRDFELSWRPIVGLQPEPAVFLERAGGHTHALLTLLPPESPYAVAARRELVFVIDTSGSMEGASLAQAKAALLRGLDSLGQADSFNVVQFNSTAESLHLQSVPASARNKRDAADYVLALLANGGTEMAPALETAFGLAEAPGALRQVIFITDGAVGNEKALFDLIESRIGDARLFTVGIGSAPNGHFMRMAARTGRGTHTFIGSIDQVEAKMATLLQRISLPVITDVTVVWPDANTEVTPAVVPDLYAGEPIVVAARFPSDPRGTVTISGRDETGAWTRQVPLATHGFSHNGIARAWARNRIDDLLGLERTGLGRGDERAAIIDLALEYQLTTPYTSLVAVAPQAERPRLAALKSAQIATTLPHGMGPGLVIDAMPRTATSAPLHLLVGILTLVLAAALTGTAYITRTSRA